MVWREGRVRFVDEGGGAVAGGVKEFCFFEVLSFFFFCRKERRVFFDP